jgi:hypothetical protein
VHFILRAHIKIININCNDVQLTEIKTAGAKYPVISPQDMQRKLEEARDVIFYQILPFKTDCRAVTRDMT